MIFVGDDWAQAHHDVYVMADDGHRLAARRFPEGAEGIRGLHDLIAGLAAEPAGVVVGIETDRGLWVQALVGAGYQVYAINPLSVSRYRDRHTVSGAKSDPADAKVLADLVRTDRHNHRRVAGDSPDVDAVQVLARTHQSLIWDRTRHTNQLRAALRAYYPAALVAFGDDLAGRDSLAVLDQAPTPSKGAVLSLTQIRTVLRRAGRQRYLDQQAGRIHTALHTSQLTAPDPLTDAYAAVVTATVKVIVEINAQISELETVLADRFDQHPDADLYLSLPGLGRVLGARVLGEFGDDPERYADAKSRRNYAGTSPITITSGTRRAVVARHVRNRRLIDAVDQWAFCSLTHSPGCRQFYEQRRAAGDTHHKALRTLGNRLVGILHGCLTHHTPYNEDTAWAHRTPATTQAA